MAFIDWLHMSQKFEELPPQVSPVYVTTRDAKTNELLTLRQPAFQYEGSYSSSVTIRITNHTIEVSGNPSRLGRMDNLWGYSTVEQCVAVFNDVLRELGLPIFTRCTEFYHSQKSGHILGANGASIHRIDMTTNTTVGKGNVLQYLRALSTIKIGHSVGNLYNNGRTVDWKTLLNHARLVYRKVYDKAYEIMIHILRDYKRRYGERSPEYQYAQALFEYCEEEGIARFEQGFRTELLSRLGLRWWGLDYDDTKLVQLHNEFLMIDEQLQVNAMDLETIAQRLLTLHIVDNAKAANTTAFYAYQWMHGHIFDVSKSQVREHRARLRKIGIDIGQPFDITRHGAISPVVITRNEEIRVNKNPTPPSWYKMPNHLRVVA